VVAIIDEKPLLWIELLAIEFVVSHLDSSACDHVSATFDLREDWHARSSEFVCSQARVSFV